jgi:hypothetical protein
LMLKNNKLLKHFIIFARSNSFACNVKLETI